MTCESPILGLLLHLLRRLSVRARADPPAPPRRLTPVFLEGESLDKSLQGSEGHDVDVDDFHLDTALVARPLERHALLDYIHDAVELVVAAQAIDYLAQRLLVSDVRLLVSDGERRTKLGSRIFGGKGALSRLPRRLPTPDSLFARLVARNPGRV